MDRSIGRVAFVNDASPLALTSHPRRPQSSVTQTPDLHCKTQDNEK